MKHIGSITTKNLEKPIQCSPVNLHVFSYVCTYVCMRSYIYVFIYIYMHVCMYACSHARLHVCVPGYRFPDFEIPALSLFDLSSCLHPDFSPEFYQHVVSLFGCTYFCDSLVWFNIL